MKKLSALIFILFISLGISAQNCNFSYTQSGVVNVYTFVPNSAFSPNHYHFVWDFGDGTTSTSVSPTHAYNALPPFVVCYNILDSANVIVCSACDTVPNQAPVNCTFSYAQTTGLTASFYSHSVPNVSVVHWSFDGGLTYSTSGNTVSNTFSAAGTYNVCMLEIEILTGDTLCNTCQNVTITSTSNNCSFTASGTPAAPFVFTFAANIAVGSTVTWDFGDNTTGTGIQATHTYNSMGTFNVCITVVDPTGTTCHYCHPVMVGSNNGNCYFTYGPNSASNSYTFTGVPAYSTSSISWDFGDGSSGSGASTSHTYSGPGTYVVCMTEVDSVGAILCTSCNTVVIGSTNNCNFVWTLAPLNPLTANFQVNGGFTSTVTWDFGDNTVGTGVNASHTYAAAGTYTVCVTIATPGALNCTYCSLVTVGNPTGACIISYYPDPNTTNGFVFNVQASSSSSMIVWDFGDGSVDIGGSVNHAYTTHGVYTVCVIERDSLQNILCQSCVTIQVGPNTSNCQASFHSTHLGLTGYFIDMSVVNTTQVSYSWDFGDGTNSTLRFPQHTYGAQGTYNVCLTIVSGSCTDVFCSTIFVDTNFTNPSNCQAFFTKVQLAPFQVTVVNLSNGVNLNFHWDFGDGSTDTQPYPSHQYATIGSYNLCLTVSDANGCTSTYCDTITVDSLGNVYRSLSGFVINVVSPAGLTGVNEIKKTQSFRAFPNPATSELYVNIIPGNVKAKGYRMLSLQGSEVLAGDMNGFDGKIEMQSLTSGTYLLEISLTDGSRSYQTIIKN